MRWLDFIWDPKDIDKPVIIADSADAIWRIEPRVVVAIRLRDPTLAKSTKGIGFVMSRGTTDAT